MSEPPLVAAREQQRELYGRPLGELVHQLTADLRITQGRLAGVLGVSAPMLSQLASGQRVKFGNPAVVGRLQGLIDLAARAGSLTPGPARAGAQRHPGEHDDADPAAACGRCAS